MLILFASLTLALQSPLQGCVTDVAKAFKYCDTTLSTDDRVDALINELTLDEKIALIVPQPKIGNVCEDHTAGIERLGIPQWTWLMEANTAIAASCYKQDRCTTTFSGPLGLAASFNRTSWQMKGQVFGHEFRAFYNLGWHRNTGGTIALTGYGPNINILRDPRFGRASELPGEDPYLNGQYAVELLKGCRMEKNGYPAMMQLLKHFTAYSKEAHRGHDTYNISMFDFFDTYLPQYEMAWKEGGADGAMCSYNGENGVPSCANGWLLNTVLREKWGQKDTIISTDCGAVANLMGPPAHAPNSEAATAWTLNNGTDLEMGSTLWTDHLKDAIGHKLVEEKRVDESIKRLYKPQFVLGRFDPVENNPWSSLGEETINSSLHQQVRDEAAAQSFVLLKNDGVLPLSRDKTVAVLGPMGQAQWGLLSSYAGDMQCFNGTDDCIPTIAASITEKNHGVTYNTKGVDVRSNSTSDIQNAVDMAKKSDIVILVMGQDKTVEHEAHDRPDTALPGNQEAFVQTIYALKKPTVLILSNGGQLAIDNLIDGANAIIEAFNPAFGGPQLADHVFGIQNRWGKLPYTMYDHDYIAQQDMSNFDMSKKPGRTYRYYTGKPLFPFGHGLSYTTFDLTPAMDHNNQALSVELKNTGKMYGEEVVLVFVRAPELDVDHPVPLRALKQFTRVGLAPGESKTLTFQMTDIDFHLINKDGERTIYPGTYDLIVSDGVQEHVIHVAVKAE